MGPLWAMLWSPGAKLKQFQTIFRLFWGEENLTQTWHKRHLKFARVCVKSVSFGKGCLRSQAGTKMARRVGNIRHEAWLCPSVFYCTTVSGSVSMCIIFVFFWFCLFWWFVFFFVFFSFLFRIFFVFLRKKYEFVYTHGEHFVFFSFLFCIFAFRKNIRIATHGEIRFQFVFFCNLQYITSASFRIFCIFVVWHFAYFRILAFLYFCITHYR